MEKQSLRYVLKETYRAWSRDKATTLAAALSFYTVFSLAPLILILIAVVGTFLDKHSVQQIIISQLEANIGNQGAQFITSAIKAENLNGHNIIVTILTVSSLMLAAVGIFGHLKSSFNTIWHVDEHSHSIKGAIKQNFVSFGLILLIGVLFVISLLLSAIVTLATNIFKETLPLPKFFIELLNQAISFGVITVLFGTAFKLLPNKNIDWTDVWEGALFTAILFTIGRFLFGFYITHTAVATRYGAAGSLIIVLLWVYYSAQILFFGAEMTKVYSIKYGSLRPRSKKGEVTPTAKVMGSFLEGLAKGVLKRNQ